MPRTLAIALLLIILLLLLLGGAAFAQSEPLVQPHPGRNPVCTPVDVLAEALQGKYGEAPRGYGLQQNGNVMMLFFGDAGSWTLVEVTPQGLACIRAAGRGWESIDPPPPAALGERGA